MNKILSADKFFKAPAEFLAGFNSRIQGDQKPNEPGSFFSGYWRAAEMINSGEVFYTHNFGCSCGGHPFTYGGTWVCNDCGNRDIQKPWWNIKVQQDGNAFCVIGEGFENLQASDNYCFGDTKQEALSHWKGLHQS